MIPKGTTEDKLVGVTRNEATNLGVKTNSKQLITANKNSKKFNTRSCAGKMCIE